MESHRPEDIDLGRLGRSYSTNMISNTTPKDDSYLQHVLPSPFQVHVKMKDLVQLLGLTLCLSLVSSLPVALAIDEETLSTPARTYGTRQAIGEALIVAGASAGVLAATELRNPRARQSLREKLIRYARISAAHLPWIGTALVSKMSDASQILR
jgi:hypothetical protein